MKLESAARVEEGERVFGLGFDGAGGRNIDEGSTAPGAEMRCHGARHAHHVEDEEIEVFVPVCVGDIEQVGFRISVEIGPLGFQTDRPFFEAGVVDHRVDLPKRPGGRLDEAFDVGGLGDRALQTDPAQFVRKLDAASRGRHEREAIAAPVQVARDRRADALARGGDDGGGAIRHGVSLTGTG